MPVSVLITKIDGVVLTDTHGRVGIAGSTPRHRSHRPGQTVVRRNGHALGAAAGLVGNVYRAVRPDLHVSVQASTLSQDPHRTGRSKGETAVITTRDKGCRYVLRGVVHGVGVQWMDRRRQAVFVVRPTADSLVIHTRGLA